MEIKTLKWKDQNGIIKPHLILFNQTQLPNAEVYLDCYCISDVQYAIEKLIVRGAPAIGVAAAYGVCLAIFNLERTSLELVLEQIGTLRSCRPTAVNLAWAVDRMTNKLYDLKKENVPQEQWYITLVEEAKKIEQEDIESCNNIANNGADLLKYLEYPPYSNQGRHINILTHCNAGALATSGEGTALSIIFELWKRKKNIHVWVDETRPLLQGSRITAWELETRKIPYTILCDSMVGHVMSKGLVDLVIVGADRIAKNGDVANKIGTYSVAVLASAHDVPFLVAAPHSTIDESISDGSYIAIEERNCAEMLSFSNKRIAPVHAQCYNPAFDVTPSKLISAIITDKAVYPLNAIHNLTDFTQQDNI